MEPSYVPVEAAYAREHRIRVMSEELDYLFTLMNGDARADVESLRYKAAAYVWGREDAGDRTRFDDWEFSLAYALHVARYKAQRHHMMTNIRSAYESYRNIGEIS